MDAAGVVKTASLQDVLDSSVVLDQEDISPFANSQLALVDVRPCAPQNQQQPKQHTRRKLFLVTRLLCCTASVQDECEHPGRFDKVVRAGTPLPGIPSQHSWTRVTAQAHDKLLPMLSRASTEYHDAHSTASDLTSQHSHEQLLFSPSGALEQHQPGLDQLVGTIPERPHWVPSEPLLFAREYEFCSIFQSWLAAVVKCMC